eukprot:Selendium_serpulae@DN2865_c0_g1_i1.p1
MLCVASCARGAKKEKKLPNQDDFFIIKGSTWGLYAAIDGHGSHGHLVSTVITRTLPSLIVEHPKFHDDPDLACKESFRKLQHFLKYPNGESEQSSKGAVKWSGNMIKDMSVNANLSGSALVLALHDTRKNRVTIAHVGDCRAMVVMRGTSNQSSGPFSLFCKQAPLKTSVIAETVDHKPEILREKKRIESSGGEVRSIDNYHGLRVFAKGLPVPGCAMTRAIGDVAAGPIGLIPDPELTTINLPKSEMAALILASDGLFEFLEPEAVAEIVCNAGPARVNEAVVELVDTALAAWRKNQGPRAEVDDMTCVVTWLPYQGKGGLISKSSKWSCWGCNQSLDAEVIRV